MHAESIYARIIYLYLLLCHYMYYMLAWQLPVPRAGVAFNCTLPYPYPVDAHPLVSKDHQIICDDNVLEGCARAGIFALRLPVLQAAVAPYHTPPYSYHFYSLQNRVGLW